MLSVFQFNSDVLPAASKQNSSADVVCVLLVLLNVWAANAPMHVHLIFCRDWNQLVAAAAAASLDELRLLRKDLILRSQYRQQWKHLLDCPPNGQLISSGMLRVINFGKSYQKFGLFKCAGVSRIKLQSMFPESKEWADQAYIFHFQSCYHVLHFETLTFHLKALSTVCSNLPTTNWNFHIYMKWKLHVCVGSSAFSWQPCWVSWA